MKSRAFYIGFALSTFLAVGCFAQVDPPGGDPPDPRVPISGIEWLLVGGGIMGARKIYLNIKKK
jgi:hypothetical protein